MAVRVVDLFEMVQVHKQKSYLTRPTFHTQQCLPEPVQQQSSIRESSHWIVQGLIREFPLRANEFCHVASAGNDPNRIAAVETQLGFQMRLKRSYVVAAAGEKVDGAAFSGRQHALQARLPNSQERLVAPNLTIRPSQDVLKHSVKHPLVRVVHVLVAKLVVVQRDRIRGCIEHCPKLDLDPAQLCVRHRELGGVVPCLRFRAYQARDITRQTKRADDLALCVKERMLRTADPPVGPIWPGFLLLLVHNRQTSSDDVLLVGVCRGGVLGTEYIEVGQAEEVLRLAVLNEAPALAQEDKATLEVLEVDDLIGRPEQVSGTNLPQLMIRPWRLRRRADLAHGGVTSRAWAALWLGSRHVLIGCGGCGLRNPPSSL